MMSLLGRCRLGLGAQGVRRPLCTAAAPIRRPLCGLPARRPLCTAAVATAGAATTGAAEGGLLAAMRAHPYKANIVIATVKTALCDVIVQKYIEKKEQIDWSRNAVFIAFGLGYLGVFQWFIYVTCFTRWFPGMALFASQPLGEKLRNAAGMRDLFKQVAFDNFVHYPFIYFPFFYLFKETIQGEGYEKAPLAVASSGLTKYQGNCAEDNLKMWALWIPGDLLIYAVPLWLRLPLNHGISFVWTCYLSFLRGDKIEEGVEERAEALVVGPAALAADVPGIRHDGRVADKRPWQMPTLPWLGGGAILFAKEANEEPHSAAAALEPSK